MTQPKTLSERETLLLSFHLLSKLNSNDKGMSQKEEEEEEKESQRIFSITDRNFCHIQVNKFDVSLHGFRRFEKEFERIFTALSQFYFCSPAKNGRKKIYNSTGTHFNRLPNARATRSEQKVKNKFISQEFQMLPIQSPYIKMRSIHGKKRC